MLLITLHTPVSDTYLKTLHNNEGRLVFTLQPGLPSSRLIQLIQADIKRAKIGKIPVINILLTAKGRQIGNILHRSENQLRQIGITFPASIDQDARYVNTPIICMANGNDIPYMCDLFNRLVLRSRMSACKDARQSYTDHNWRRLIGIPHPPKDDILNTWIDLRIIRVKRKWRPKVPSKQLTGWQREKRRQVASLSNLIEDREDTYCDVYRCKMSSKACTANIQLARRMVEKILADPQSVNDMWEYEISRMMICGKCYRATINQQHLEVARLAAINAIRQICKPIWEVL